MALLFPNPSTQTPINTFSPTSTPVANTTNNLTYTYNVSKGVWISEGTPIEEVLGNSLKNVVNLRMSLSSTSPVPSANQSGSILYIHPFNGNEIALFDDSVENPRWYLLEFPNSPIPSFSFSSLSANRLHDVYAFNAGDVEAPDLDIEFVAWANDTTPPTKTMKDGIPCKNGDPTKRYIGVLRTTSAGTSIVDLGGDYSGFNDPPNSVDESANFPRVFLSNLYNQYDTRIVYFFGDPTAPNSGWWNYPGSGPWGVVPGPLPRRLAGILEGGAAGGTWQDCYATPPQIQFVQASETLVTVFMDIYSNEMTITGYDTPNVVYVAPGINDTVPPDDAFYGECGWGGNNTTVGSQWARSLPIRLHTIYYLFRQLNASRVTKINEHSAHGMIVIMKS